MEETRESGVTFGEICKVIKKRIWIVLIVTFTLAFIAFLAARYIYNPRKETYSVSFILTYPSSEDRKYPDGSPFYYQDMISAEKLTAAKNADKAFSDIDVEKLSAEDKIGIQAETRENGGALQYTGRYTVTVSSKYFSDREQAADFLTVLVDLTRTEVVDAAEKMNYRLDDSAFNDADFSGKLELLSRQKDSLINEYNRWIELYSDNYSVAGKTLVNHRAEAEAIFGSAVRNSLYTELEINGYVPLSLVTERRALLTAEKERNNTQIEELKELLKLNTAAGSLESGNLTVFDFSEKLSSLTTRNVEIDVQLANMTEENIKNFEKKLSEVYATMQAAADKVHEVGIALCNQETRAYLETSQAIEEGGLSSVLAAIVGAVLGFVLSCLVVYFTEIPKSRRLGAVSEEESGEAPEPAPFGGPAEETAEAEETSEETSGERAEENADEDQ